MSGIVCPKGRLRSWTALGFWFIALGFAGAQLAYVPSIYTAAGNHTAGYQGDGGAATSAEMKSPNCVAIDSSGNIYVAEWGNSVVRKIASATGLISTVAGTGVAGFSGDGGAATSAQLNRPSGIAVDSSGNLYIADGSNNRIREVTASNGRINTIAGNGTASYAGDGAAATGAELNGPTSVALDGSGNLYIADYGNSRIRKITSSSGFITTVAGSAAAGFTGDGGLATSAELYGPWGVYVDSSGNLFIADTLNNRIREVTASDGNINTIAGNGTGGYSGDTGTATSAELNNPRTILLDGNGNYIIGDYANNRIREVNLSTNIITTIAGNGTGSYAGDQGAAASAELYFPIGLAFDPAGNLYIGDNKNNVVRRVTILPAFPPGVAGSTSTTENILVQVTGTAGVTGFTVAQSQGGKQEFTTGTMTGCSSSSNPTGTICTLPVTFAPSYPGMRAAALSAATTAGTVNFGMDGLAFGPLGIFTPGIISTVAGSGTGGYTGDGGAATSAQLDNANGVAIDNAGNFYIGDWTNNVVRKVTA